MRITCRWGLRPGFKRCLRTLCRVTSRGKTTHPRTLELCLVVTDTGFSLILIFFLLVRYSTAMSLRIPRLVRFSASRTTKFLTHVIPTPILVVLATARVSSIPGSLLVPAEVFLLHRAYHGTFLLCASSFLWLTLHKSLLSLFAWRGTHLVSCRSLPIVTGARKPNGRSHTTHKS